MKEVKVIHEDNPNCSGCWTGFPTKCLGCGNLIHAHIIYVYVNPHSGDDHNIRHERCYGCGKEYIGDGRK